MNGATPDAIARRAIIDAAIAYARAHDFDDEQLTRLLVAWTAQGRLRFGIVGPCTYCGDPFANSVDHINPRGGNDPDNLASACWTCNARKGKRTLSQWVKEKDYRRPLIWGPRVEPPEGVKWLSVSEVADTLGIDVHWLRDQVRLGTFTLAVIRLGRTIRISIDELDVIHRAATEAFQSRLADTHPDTHGLGQTDTERAYP